MLEFLGVIFLAIICITAIFALRYAIFRINEEWVDYTLMKGRVNEIWETLHKNSKN